MTNPLLITPPPELVQQWAAEARSETFATQHLCNQAAQWGADQELEACVKWIEDCGYHPSVPEDLRAARRPKPPSLKEQALKGFDNISTFVLDEHEGTSFYEEYKKITDTVLRALETLDDN